MIQVSPGDGTEHHNPGDGTDHHDPGDGTDHHDPDPGDGTDHHDDANNVPQIFISYIEKSRKTSLGRKKKHSRVWNTFSYCLYCDYAGNNVSGHLRKMHGVVSNP